MQRIGGLCVRLVLVAPLGHRPHLEESIYPFEEHVNVDLLGGQKESDGPLAQKAARPPGRCLRSWRLGGTQPGFLAEIGSVLPGAAPAATWRMNVGTAVDICGQETMQKHTGLLRSEAAFGEDDWSCSFVGCEADGVQERRGSEPPCRSLRWIIATTASLVTTSGSRSFSVNGQAVAARTLLMRTKANFRWIEYSERDRSQLELRCFVRVLEAALFYGLSLTAMASFEHPRRQAQWFGGVHACGCQWSWPEGLLERLGSGEALKLEVRLDGEGGDDAVYETDWFLCQSCGGKIAPSAC